MLRDQELRAVGRGVRFIAMAAAVAATACGSKSTASPEDSGPPGSTDDADAADGEIAPECVLGTPAARTKKTVTGYPLDDTLRMNQLQAKATHNSYHLAPKDPKARAEFLYSHAPLDVQLDKQGVRGLELDVTWNDNICRFEVYHFPIIDDNTTCKQFTDCLQIIRTWSDAHQGHQPLLVAVEPKDDFGETQAEMRLTRLEQEILSVWPRETIITPDEVKGTSSTVAGALADHGWPTLGKTRGRVLFYFLAGGANRQIYTHGEKDLDGRLLFITAEPTMPFAPYSSVLAIDDAIASKAVIEAAVKQNLIVRTLTDKSLETAKAGDTTLFEAALPTGAHLFATDFPAKVSTDPSAHVTDIPGGTPSRCNPVTAPPTCTPDAIESAAHL